MKMLRLIVILSLLFIGLCAPADDLFRQKFCSGWLGLSLQADKDCEQAASYLVFEGSNKGVGSPGELLCCLGMLDPHPYKLNSKDLAVFKDRISVDLLRFILSIQDAGTFVSVLNFLSACKNSSKELSKTLYSEWLQSGGC